jgi:hypothetical protein
MVPPVRVIGGSRPNRKGDHLLVPGSRAGEKAIELFPGFGVEHLEGCHELLPPTLHLIGRQ